MNQHDELDILRRKTSFKCANKRRTKKQTEKNIKSKCRSKNFSIHPIGWNTNLHCKKIQNRPNVTTTIQCEN